MTVANTKQTSDISQTLVYRNLVEQNKNNLSKWGNLTEKGCLPKHSMQRQSTKKVHRLSEISVNMDQHSSPCSSYSGLTASVTGNWIGASWGKKINKTRVILEGFLEPRL